MRKPGIGSGPKVWAQLTNPVTNSLTKLDYHVNVDHIIHLHVGHHVHLHVDHQVGHHNVVLTLCEGSEMLTELKSKSGVTDGRRTVRGS